MDTPTTPKQSHWPSIFLALLSGLGVLIGLAAFLLLGLAALLRPSSNTGGLGFAWAAGLFALLNLPALAYSAPRAFGQPALRWDVKIGWRLASIAMGLWVLDLAGATWLVEQPSARLNQIFFPPMSVLAVAIPLWWLIEWGRRGLRVSSQRSWGTASLSLMITMPLVLVLEVIGLLGLGIVIFVGLLGTAPDLWSQIVEAATSGDRYEISTLLQPYLTQPWMIFVGMAAVSVLGPLLEEALKPLALWFVPGRRLTEPQGFVLGLVAGGCFALLETLGNLQAMAHQDAPMWLLLLLTRTGTGLLHITCSGLVGWGLSAAWHARRYRRLLKLYLLAVLIHGAWNLCAQLITFGTAGGDNPWLKVLGIAAPLALFGLVLAMLALLRSINRRLNLQQAADDQPAVLPLPGAGEIALAPVLAPVEPAFQSPPVEL